MLNLLVPFIFVFTLIFSIIFTMIWSFFITLAGLVKLLLPFKSVSSQATQFADLMMWGWCVCLAIVLNQINHVEWDVEGIDELSKKNWYLLICNHKSWADVVVLCALFRNRIPMNKYFLKRQLLWVPFVGLACWALDMPFMKRHSRRTLLKNPHLRDQDIETTRRSCEKYRQHPTTVVNFVEGSRFTEQKRLKTKSPYCNLLPPKAVSLAFALNTLSEQFDKILNVTLLYPDNQSQPFLDILCGRMKRITIRVETLLISDNIHGDYLNNKIYKRQFQLWLNQLWQDKDNLLNNLISQQVDHQNQTKK